VIPKGDWFCEKCADESMNASTSKSPIKIVCCDQQTGPLKRCPTRGHYIHSLCALWNPKVKISKDLQSILDIPPTNHSTTAECVFCFKVDGLLVDCKADDCKLSFHISCLCKEHVLNLLPPRLIDNQRVYCILHKEMYDESGDGKKRKRLAISSSSDEAEIDPDEDEDTTTSVKRNRTGIDCTKRRQKQMPYAITTETSRRSDKSNIIKDKSLSNYLFNDASKDHQKKYER